MVQEEASRQAFGDPKDLVPLLSPHHHRETAKEYCAIRPFPGGASPVVVLAWDLPSAVIFAPRSFDFDELFPTALANLRKREEHAEWLELEARSPSGPVKVLVREGGWLTASDLCDPEFLRATAKRLGQDTVFFATPTRECMIASTDDQVVGAFAREALERNDDGQFEIGRQVYRFDGNELSLLGLVMAPGEKEEDVTGPRPRSRGASKKRKRAALEFDTTPRAPLHESAGHVPLGLRVSMPNGEFMMVLPLTEPTVLHVSAKVRLLLAERLPDYCKEPDFNGVVEFLVNPELIGDTPEQREMLERLRTSWNRDLDEKKTATKDGRPIRVLARFWSLGSEPEPSAENVSAADPVPSPPQNQESSEERRERERRWEERRVEEEHEAKKSDLRRERALRFGLSLALFTAAFGFLVVLVREGLSLYVLPPALTAVVTLTALVLSRRGSIFGRALSGGVCLALGRAGLLAPTGDVGSRAEVLLQALWVIEGALFLLAGCFLLIGLERRPPNADRRHDVPFRVIGVALGFLLAYFLGLPPAQVCSPYTSRSDWIGLQNPGCRDLSTKTCSTVPGCRVTEPLCVASKACRAERCAKDCASKRTRAECSSFYCEFQECTGTPTKACSDFNATSCPEKLCQTKAL